MKEMILFLLISANLIPDNSFFQKTIGKSIVYGCPEYDDEFVFEKTGDINGDGYIDIIGKLNVWNGWTYCIWIIYGSSERLPEEISICDYSSRMTYMYGNGNWSYLVGIQVGDFNGDGYDDLVIGNWWTSIQSDYPEVFIIYGSADLPQQIEIGNFPPNLKVTRIEARDEYSHLGQYISKGDMNGDGYEDLILDENIYCYPEEQFVHIIYGASIGIPNMDIENPPANTISISGMQHAFPLDVNNDARMDLFTAYGWDGFDGERQYADLVLVLYNSEYGFPNEVDKTNPPENSTIIYGAKKNDTTGRNVFFEDIDLDGYKDLIISADGSYSSDGKKKGVGKIWILYGTPEAFPKTIDLLYPPEASTVIYGANQYDAFGTEVDVGDINNDGYLDIISSNAAWNDFTGKMWILYGNGKRLPKVVELSNPPEDIKFYTIEGYDINDTFGLKPKIIDLDKDGLKDFIFSSCIHKSYSGHYICEFNIFYYILFKFIN